MIDFRHLNLSRQFLISSFPIIFAGMLLIDFWVGAEIERGVVNRLGAVTSLYVDSLVAPHLRVMQGGAALDAVNQKALDKVLSDTPLGQKIVAFNIWRADGRLLYSTHAGAVGRTFPVGEGLATALGGEVYSKIVGRPDTEHGFTSGAWPSRLIETYTPVHAETLGRVIGAAEFYQTTDELDREAAGAQRRSWLAVAVATALIYLALFGLVRRGSQTIDAQRRELNARVTELSSLLARNAQLDARVRAAAARNAAGNERFLRRISRDLHDGPGQDMGYALMRIETIIERLLRAPADLAPPQLTADLGAVRLGLESALAELRTISAGLQLPDLGPLSTREIAERAVRDFQRKTGASVDLAVTGEAGETALPVKIALYRLLQESLANGFRHADGIDLRVALTHDDGFLAVRISDGGPGFEPGTQAQAGHLGMTGMRERVESLGGVFELDAAAGRGTRITARMPLQVPGAGDE